MYTRILVIIVWVLANLYGFMLLEKRRAETDAAKSVEVQRSRN